MSRIKPPIATLLNGPSPSARLFLAILQLRDDDAKEGMGGLTAPRSLVIRLEETTKGVQKGDRVLAVFPDTTSFYVGTIHRVSGFGAVSLINC